MKMATYSRYKTSAATWLGDVPEHWTIERIKYALTEKRARPAPNLPAGAISYGRVVVKNSDRMLEETKATYQEVLSGDYLINPINLNYDLVSLRTALSKLDVVVSPAYIVAKANAAKLHNEFGQFLLYVFDIRHMKSLGAGVRQTIGFDDIGNSFWALPPMEEQALIAAFLQQETIRIDSIVDKKHKFMELLREKRAACISSAVTNGIGRANEFQPSGLKSIGDVPSHWAMSPVGRALRQTKRVVGDKHDSYKLLSLTTRGVIERDTSDNAGKFPESFETYQEVRPGQFVFCLFDMDETPRTVGLSERHGMITGAYAVFECLDRDFAGYLFYLFLHLDTCKGLKPHYTGLRKTIRPTKFTSIRIPFPPVEEAVSIAHYLDEQTKRIDILIAKTERSIELLKEHRSALITAAVTGKIDVRGLAAKNMKAAA